MPVHMIRILFKYAPLVLLRNYPFVAMRLCNFCRLNGMNLTKIAFPCFSENH